VLEQSSSMTQHSKPVINARPLTTTSVFNPDTEAKVSSLLQIGWGESNVRDLQLAFQYSSEDDD
jgi:hypothetical protein